MADRKGKGVLSVLFGPKKSSCCNVQIEEVTEDATEGDAMATYVYKTIPGKPGEKPKRFEIQQRMSDEPLVTHPETGEPVRRVISGGLGTITSRGKQADGSRGERTLQCSCGGNCE